MEYGFPVCLHLAEDTPPERNALAELDALLETEETVKRLKEAGGFFKDPGSRLCAAAVTPDFHKGAGIPIGTVLLTKGFVIPSAMGNDINCGMRFYTTDLSEERLRARMPELRPKLRHLFFEGGRDIPMRDVQREAMLREGLQGLLETANQAEGKGIWAYYHREEQEADLAAVQGRGSIPASDVPGLLDYIAQSGNLSYDAQIGSIGGGNHFVEVQRVAEVFDGGTAGAWGIKKGSLAVMIHSGSLMIGHQSGLLNRQLCESVYPKNLDHPKNKIFPLPEGPYYQKAWDTFWNTTANSANFAFANRLFLGLMLQKAIAETVEECAFRLLYDSPHNFIWKREEKGETLYLHRKGACSADGLEAMENSAFAYYGEPVMIPGSMGSSSYLLAGEGNQNSLWSASHGAGRKLSRGEAIHGNEALFRSFMEKFQIITPVDPERSDLRGRRDILDKWEESIRAEAPYAYKDIDSVVRVHTRDRLARLVARMEPVFTIKA